MRVGENSRDRYLHSYRTYVREVFGCKTLAQVAQDRDGATEHLIVTMKHLSNTPRQQARLVIEGTCEEAIGHPDRTFTVRATLYTGKPCMG